MLLLYLNLLTHIIGTERHDTLYSLYPASGKPDITYAGIARP